MQCRHTVPDWHRYVDPAADPAPIFAACRLLVKAEAPARDPRSIACTYWGHQRDCPLFEGAGGAAGMEPRAAERPASRDVPVAMEAVWPVRPPGARDGMRLVLIGLGAVSIVLMLLTVGVGFAVLRGESRHAGYLHLVWVAAMASIATHVLATLRAWARR
jgi:hypothetical protein